MTLVAFVVLGGSIAGLLGSCFNNHHAMKESKRYAVGAYEPYKSEYLVLARQFRTRRNLALFSSLFAIVGWLVILAELHGTR